MKRALWKSRIGFIWAAVGSAVGLGNIWRFPYVVGENGGAAFVIIYLICLALVGFPVLISEILIGRKTHTSPYGAFKTLGRREGFGSMGKMTILTGFLISAFYSVIAGWTLGYLIEAIMGNMTQFTSTGEAMGYFKNLSDSPYWSVGFHGCFMFLSALILITGVNKGIESGNKIMMPLLFVMLVALAIKGILLPGSEKGLRFLFTPDFSSITPTAVIFALGQAFFALSLGQGTMVTYGSYISQKENLPTTAVSIPIFGTFISILAGMAVFSIVFAVGMRPESGPSLMFQTLPLVFSQIPGGYFVAIAFFLLILLAGLTSEISAMEPLISYLVDEKKWRRKNAVLCTAAGAFTIGVPCALSFGLWSHITLFGKNFFDLLSYVCINILVPLGGLAAVLLVGWRWGLKKAMAHLQEGAGELLQRFPIISFYFRYGIKYVAPLIIIIIMLDFLLK